MADEFDVNAKVSDEAKYVDGKIYDLPVGDILEDKEQPRKFFDKQALEALKESIKAYGLMQPIVFRQREDDGKLIVVAGERRVKAIKSILRKAKENPDDPELQVLFQRFRTIPGMFVEGKHQEIALIENVQRENLNPVELAEGLAKLREEGKYGLDHLGTMIGKSMSSVSEILSINKIPEEILDEARKRKDVSQWVLVEVAKAKGPKAKAKKWDHLKDSGMTQAAYKKKKKEAAEMDEERGFNFGSSVRAVKTASTQLQKLKGPDIGSIQPEQREELRTQLETLRDELEQVLEGLK
ncbi:ParB/RepB/Spo0J family partition protein [Megalodesulfovibrio gigas]|uniref:Putative ParB-like partition protein n=1 Tax=Megalodesulfovibrio gigas (strain ATCC 19364 / DSM 1382 / NCIMB 9332 / VKM B-1759) TaxID=1121448 RepID=T2GD47_MEGG1|nr:ParB N-terminal domain-containing protein [Megalodesulfovibrio gigas]AGW13842.1 putative ParB-like partition protein [Megalodesulfovibrio gigas DSM 1382 = ATCC 19364]